MSCLWSSGPWRRAAILVVIEMSEDNCTCFLCLMSEDSRNLLTRWRLSRRPVFRFCQFITFLAPYSVGMPSGSSDYLLLIGWLDQNKGDRAHCAESLHAAASSEGLKWSGKKPVISPAPRLTQHRISVPIAQSLCQIPLFGNLDQTRKRSASMSMVLD